MSEHEIEQVNEGVSRVVAGWRSEFGSFYAHIYMPGDYWPTPTLEIGEDFDEVTDPRHLVEFLDGYATVPAGFADVLRADAEKEGTCDLPALLAVQDPRPAVYHLAEADIPF